MMYSIRKSLFRNSQIEQQVVLITLLDSNISGKLSHFQVFTEGALSEWTESLQLKQ